jgi:predicted RNA binding protein YcfA (HicA-like mRNA interferase family)
MPLPRLPALSAREIIAALRRAGFVEDRQSGSHVTMVNEARRRAAVIPVHSGRDVAVGTVHNILRQAGLTVEEFLRLLG